MLLFYELLIFFRKCGGTYRPLVAVASEANVLDVPLVAAVAASSTPLSAGGRCC